MKKLQPKKAGTRAVDRIVTQLLRPVRRKRYKGRRR